MEEGVYALYVEFHVVLVAEFSLRTADSGSDGSGVKDGDNADVDEDDLESEAEAAPLDHCSHLQHVIRALASLIRDPHFAEVRLATSPDVQAQLAVIVSAAEAEAAKGVPLGALGPVDP